jgi:hypothetical protein
MRTSQYICGLESHNDRSISLTPNCAADESMHMLEIRYLICTGAFIYEVALQQAHVKFIYIIEIETRRLGKD